MHMLVQFSTFCWMGAAPCLSMTPESELEQKTLLSYLTAFVQILVSRQPSRDLFQVSAMLFLSKVIMLLISTGTCMGTAWQPGFDGKGLSAQLFLALGAPSSGEIGLKGEGSPDREGKRVRVCWQNRDMLGTNLPVGLNFIVKAQCLSKYSFLFALCPVMI